MTSPSVQHERYTTDLVLADDWFGWAAATSPATRSPRTSPTARKSTTGRREILDWSCRLLPVEMFVEDGSVSGVAVESGEIGFRLDLVDAETMFETVLDGVQ